MRQIIGTAKLLFACGVLSNAFAVVEPLRPALTNFDARPKEFPPQARAEKHHAAAQLRQLAPHARIEFHEITGSPKRIAATRGFLTGPNGLGGAVSDESALAFRADDSHRATKAFLREHQALFGHGPEILATARVKREITTAHNGLRTVVWEQQVDGIPVFEAALIAHTTRRGELVSISSQFVSDAPAAADKGHRTQARKRNEPGISAAEAVLKAAQNVGEHLQPGDVQPREQPGGSGRKQRFNAKSHGDMEAKLVWLPVGSTELRLCWEIILTGRSRGEMFRVLVDAETGNALVRHCLTDYASEATFRVHTGDSPTPLSPGHAAPSTLQPPVVPRDLVTLVALNTNASPLGWINEGDNETRGNNVDAHSDHDHDNEPDLPRPQGAPFRVFDFPLDLTQHPTNYTRAAIAQLFYWCNWMHDRLYELGFTEAAGNFQVDNLGRGGEGNDAVTAQAQDGGFFSNANFSTPPDGEPGRMQMFIWTEPYPDRDGDLDAEVILHEYTHGMTRRQVGGGLGFTALQSMGMNEGWSDFFAMAMLAQSSDDVNGVYPMGGYSSYLLGNTQNYYFGIRRYPYCTDTNKNPLTFRDIDPGQISSHPGVPRHPAIGFNTNEALRVHRQGEVWCMTLWEVRANLIRKHGFEMGNRLTLQLVADGQRLCPPNPDFLQSRDAVIQADFVNTGGANFRDIWAGFARRGMGFSAVCPPSPVSTGVREAFDLPDDLWVMSRVKWTAKGKTGGPFEPRSRTFTVENLGSAPITWSVYANVGWLSFSNGGGILETGRVANVEASINTMANLLPAGMHFGSMVFTNHSTGRCQTNAVGLNVDQLDFLVEDFNLRDNDVAFRSITFTPDGSISFYSVCQAPATNFPVDPAGGTRFATSIIDRNKPVTLSGGRTVALFGVQTNTFLISFDGSVMFSDQNNGGEWVLENHFDALRISCLRGIWEFTNGVRSWKELSDRFVVTHENISTLTTTNRSSFQMELFYDGRIRFTYLHLDTREGIVGLSRGPGRGLPPGFVESDFTAYPVCLTPLLLAAPTNAGEGAGILPASVRRPLPEATELLVNISCSDPGEVSVPASVIIPAGETTGHFGITVLDDPHPDGPQAPLLTASAPGFGSAHAAVLVADDETNHLTLSVPSATEGETVVGTVSMTAAAARNIFVSLNSMDTSEARPATSVIIPAGSTSAVFEVTVVDDTLIDGPQLVELVAQVANWPAASGSMLVQDNEAPSLTLSLAGHFSEAAGVVNTGGFVRIPGTLTSNLLVSLNSSDASELQIPPTVTVLAGQTLASFPLTLVNDPDTDGPQTVNVTAQVPGWAGDSAGVTVHDDETPSEPFAPTPPHLAEHQPFPVTLSWKSGLGNVISNGDFELGTFNGWTKDFPPNDADTVGSAVRFVINDGTYDPERDHYEAPGPSPPYAGAFSALALGSTGSSGWGRMFQQVTLLPNASSATLSWVDRIVNVQGQFSPTQYFTMEIRGTNDDLREVLFLTSSGFPSTNNWVTRSFSLSRYLGETIRLVWKQEYYSRPLLAHLDNMALQVASSIPTRFDVYFGTNASPGANEFRGNTTNHVWAATNLQADTTYFWRIVAKRGPGEVSGPVWQFRTRSVVDHLQWSAIATQQYVGEPITVAVTARGKTNQTIPGFDAPVTLSGTAMTGHRKLFVDNFEDGNYSGWQAEDSPGSYTRQVTTLTAAAGNYSLTLSGGNQRHNDGLTYEFPRFSMRPDQINFSVRSSSSNKAAGYLSIGNSHGVGAVGVTFYMGASGRMGIFEQTTGFHATNYVANRWYRISIVFDWTRRRVSCFVDGQRIASSVPFRNPFLDDVASLHLYNYHSAQAWWDEIEILDGNRTVPIVVSPATVSPFSGGVWRGEVSVHEPAAAMWLTALDPAGNTGASGTFAVDSSADLDDDGLPDAWETRFFGSLNSSQGAAGADADEDGLANREEFRAGTIPTDADSALRISAVGLTGGVLSVGFETVAGKAYQLERATRLGGDAWTSIGSLLLGTGQQIQVADPIQSQIANQFYRVRLAP